MIIVSMLAFLGFFLSLAAHLSTFSSLNLIQDFPAVWALHIGAIALFLPVAYSQRRELGKKRGGNQAFKQLIGHMPMWARPLLAVFAVYAFINFFIGMNATVSHDKNNISEEKEPVTTKIKADGGNYERLQLRMFSGHWMIFYLIPACYFLSRRPKRLF